MIWLWQNLIHGSGRKIVCSRIYIKSVYEASKQNKTHSHSSKGERILSD